ncbi:cell cycle progression protein 1 isoform X2 [Scleropages formosus]|uniref:Cell cycle progression protein 1-like n=1 Tax=Scleropages formosus TaxID=113540 RepID=A0A8C9SSP3_SCLFO|nr:cell cycle progression protein 1 isoform X2 [Scleropages formosus]
MSESSSDTESSCGWTIISNEGSDIETLGPENGSDGGPEVGCDTGTEAGPDVADSSAAPEQAELVECSEELSPESTLKEEVLDETQPVSEAGGEVVAEEQVTLSSSSDHSDIITLEPSKMEEQAEAEVEEESVGPEELYLGTSSSSQYAFSAAESTLFLASPPVGDSTSSEDEGAEQPSPILRRRRTRRSTATVSETEEMQPQGQQEPQGQPEPQEPHVAPLRGQVSGTLNKCILLALVIAISMGFGHFYGTMQIQERQKIVEKFRVSELTDIKGDLQQCQKEQDVIVKNQEVVQRLREDLEEKHSMLLSLTGIMDKITKENQQLKLKQAELQAEKEDLSLHLKLTEEEKAEMESHQTHLATENRHLKSSLEREEESVSTLQEELRNLRAQIRSLEEKGAGADSILSENQRLKDHLEDERQRIRSFLSQKEALMAEAQMLRRELDKERRVTDRLKEEVAQLSSRSARAGGTADTETKELQARLMELEKKLNFEQQRSDLWERLYVETKEERTKGDNELRVKKPKEGVMSKVKETFDAVKNSTKEFVHHHKEQIKKAKEAVKENLRKFSDSVKSTFRHFKDSATHMFDKARRPHQRRFHERKDARAERCEKQQECPGHLRHKNLDEKSWPQKPLHRHPRKATVDSFEEGSNTRKPGAKVLENTEQGPYRSTAKGCSGVFDCAYQESMSLFNKALEPIRADEFNQLIHSYLQQEVDHFHHWRELESFINGFFHNGVFIHDQMLFTDFVSGVEDYLEDIDEYQRYDNDVFEDLDDYVYRHFFGDTYSKQYGPSRPFERPVSKVSKEDREPRHRQQHKHLRVQPRPQAERKWSRPGRTSGRHVANVKIELGPMPFDPKY